MITDIDRCGAEPSGVTPSRTNVTNPEHHIQRAAPPAQVERSRKGVAGLPVVTPHVLTTMLAGLLSILAGTNLTAQQNVPDVPRLLSYQGVLVEPDGTKVQDATYVITIRLYETPNGGTPIWEETQSVVTLDGVFDAILGLTTPLDNTPFDRQYWLAVELQGEAEMTPRTMVVSAPYALRAYRSSITDSIVGGHVASVNNIQGHLNLLEGNGISISASGQDITITATGTGMGGGDTNLTYGSIWYGDPSNRPTERPIGRPHDVLTVNSAGTEPVWSNRLILQSIDVDSLLVNGHARIDGTVIVDNDAQFNGPVRFEQLPDFPLQKNAVLIGNNQGRAAEYPSSDRPGQVLRLDAAGTPIWQDLDPAGLGIASGRVETNGQLRQTVPEAAVTPGSKVIVAYEDPSGGAVIPVQIISQNPGTDFTVLFTALPPEGTFLVYTVMP